MITEKERNIETNKLTHLALAIINNIKHRLDSLVSKNSEYNRARTTCALNVIPLCFHRRVDKVRSITYARD